MKANKSLTIIYPIAILCSLFLIARWGVIEKYDSISYISAWNSIAEGHLDLLRTPAYPLFLHIIRAVFPKSALIATICVQHLIFLISVFFFERLLHSFIKSDRIIFWLTLFYAVFPAVNTWANCILTESLAISGSVFLLYLICRVTNNPSFITLLLFTILIIFLLLLRPIFIYILPVIFITMLYLACLRKKGGIAGIICASIASFAIFGYMREFKREYGLFSFSSVSTINQYYMARQYNVIIPKSIQDPALCHDIDSLYKINGDIVYEHKTLWNEANYLASIHPLNVLNNEIGRMSRINFKATAHGLSKRFAQASKEFLFTTFIWDLTKLFGFGFFSGSLYFFLIVFSSILLTWIIRNKGLPWKTLLILMLGVSNIIVAIVGGQEDWARLTSPSIPIWIILIGQFCELFQRKPFNEVLFE